MPTSTPPRSLLDRAGFPMIRLDPPGGFIHWLPVTKIQFEAFLCDRPPASFAPPWYEALLTLNPRVAPHRVQASNYWGAFVTGIKPEEAAAFAAWCGADFGLPTREEWFSVYRLARATAAVPAAAIARTGRTPRARSLIERLETATTALQPRDRPRTLADQMLLRRGVMEWVECSERQRRWGAFGQPHVRFHGNLYDLESGRPSFPTDLDQRRLHSHGFRLIQRGNGIIS